MAKTVTLDEARSCLNGMAPAVVATCSADGVPNATYLSKVKYVDSTHIALSNQFFRKTSANIAENPFAQLVLMGPATLRQYRFDIMFERREHAGPLFDEMDDQIRAIASLMHMEDTFRLRAVDVYQVLRGEAVTSDLGQ